MMMMMMMMVMVMVMMMMMVVVMMMVVGWLVGWLFGWWVVSGVGRGAKSPILYIQTPDRPPQRLLCYY